MKTRTDRGTEQNIYTEKYTNKYADRTEGQRSKNVNKKIKEEGKRDVNNTTRRFVPSFLLLG
jgi:hypothetical protein